MEDKIKQEAPATLVEAWNHGVKTGLELNEARTQMRELIAHRIKVLRMEAKLTQEELSIKTGINRLTYRGYENCKSDIPLVYLIRIADYYQVSLDYLTGRTEDRTCSKIVYSGMEPERKAELSAKLDDLTAMLVNIMGAHEKLMEEHRQLMKGIIK